MTFMIIKEFHWITPKKGKQNAYSSCGDTGQTHAPKTTAPTGIVKRIVKRIVKQRPVDPSG
jgi:hypothetical protein